MKQIDINKRTIVYIFGPKRLTEKYNNNEQLFKNEGGWLKIGQTDDVFAVDKWTASMNRITSESRTGIPETCRLYDAFEFPATGEKIDDAIRKILTSDMYELENSMANNKLIKDSLEIRAGQEFVYGVTRNNVLNAIARYERDLLIKYHNTDFQNFAINLIIRNNETETDDSQEDDSSTNNINNSDEKPWILFWNHLQTTLPENLINKLHFPKIPKTDIPRAYGSLTTGYIGNGFICFGYSIRKNNVGVSFIVDGDIAKEKMILTIQQNESEFTKQLSLHQGEKNLNKWEVKTCLSLDNNENTIKEWLITNIVKMDKLFTIS